jgi:Helicase associated domain
LKQIGRHNTLTDEREELLDSVGFVWDSHQASWNDHYQRLENFFQVHGHVQIPITENPTYSSLSTWCKHQRRQYRNYLQQQQQGSTVANNNNNTTMTVERIRKLDLLGFEWNPRKLTAAVTTGDRNNKW